MLHYLTDMGNLKEDLNLKTLLDIFASRYVIKSMRDRFVHEAIKRPKKFYQRLCHGSLFEDRFLGRPDHIPQAQHYLSFVASGRYEIIPGTEFSLDAMQAGDGGLVMSFDAQWFWACDEAGQRQPTKHYHSAKWP